MTYTLFVPVDIKALVVNDEARKRQNFQRWRMNYANLEYYASASPAAFSDNSAANWNNTPSANGVYLRWILPHALRSGAHDRQTGAVDYPYAPNRWLVVRRSGPQERRDNAAWVIESDFIDPNEGTSPYIAPTSKKRLQPTLIGRKIDLAEWRESAEAAPHLTAVGAGDLTFSVFQPNMENVFSAHDPLTDVAAEDSISYMVAGWYADPTADILAAAADAATFAAKLADLKWRVADAPRAAPCQQSVYHGATHAVQWHQTGPAPTSDRPADAATAVSVAVADNAIDGLTALIKKQTETAGQSVRADLLAAFQYSLLPTLDMPNGPDLLNQAIHKAWFGAGPGGYEWTIIDKPEAADGAPSQAPKPAKPITWNDPSLEPDWLAELNQQQHAYDGHLRELRALQSRLYRMWWAKGRYDNLSSAQRQLLPRGEYSDALFDEQLDPKTTQSLAAQIQNMTAQAAAAQNNLPGGETADELLRNIDIFAAQRDLPANRQLKRIAKNPFFKASDPVALIAGAKAADILVDDQPLTCRFASQLITSMSWQGVNLNASTIQKLLPNLDHAPPPITQILVDSFLLDPDNAAEILIAAGLRERSPAAIAALKKQIAEQKNMHGNPPDLPPMTWRQPWSPLFLMWTAFHYPIEHHNPNGADNWTFDGQRYNLTGKTPLDQPVDDVFSGIALLTPKSSFNFKKRLDEFRRQHPDLNAAELDTLEKFIADTDHWDFLSQTLEGFSAQMAAAEPGSHIIPADHTDIATLVGDQNASPPDLGGLPVRFKGWPKSRFQSYRAGQFCFEKLMIVDCFGQAIDIINSHNYLKINPAISPNLTPQPDKTVLAQEPYRFIQLPPRLLQPARLNFEFVSALDDEKPIHLHNSVTPIAAWLLPNHIDKSLACYDPDGAALGALAARINPQGEKYAHWSPAPDADYLTVQQLNAPFPCLGGMLTALIEQGADAFADFLRAIDETLWTVDPLGNRDDQNLSTLIGRPLALTRASLQYQLDGPPLADPSWQYLFKPAAPQFTQYRFPIKLGQPILRNDGLIGYFQGDDYSRFNNAGPIGNTDSPYLQPVQTGNFINLTFQGGDQTYITMLIDPRAPVHATTDILPISTLELPPKFIESALQSMAVFFHAGPLLSASKSVAALTPEAEPGQTAVLMPKPAEKHGQWQWLSIQDGDWRANNIEPANPKAEFSNTPAILRTGMFKLSGGIGNGKIK